MAVDGGIKVSERVDGVTSVVATWSNLKKNHCYYYYYYIYSIEIEFPQDIFSIKMFRDNV